MPHAQHLKHLLRSVWPFSEVVRLYGLWQAGSAESSFAGLLQDLVQEIAAGAALKAQDHQMFKLEDIAVGSWVEWVGKDRMWDIHYVADQAFNYNGCNGQDAVSHYIKPRGMRCMFKNGGACCKASSLSQPHLRGGSNSEE